MAAWRKAKARASRAGRWSRPAADAARRSSLTFLERQSIVTLPPAEPLVVAPTPDFYRWSFASMWTPGPFESQAEPRVLLPDRRRPVVAAGAPGRAPARLQRADAVVDLDPRGLPGPLPALPAPAARRVQGPQVDPVRAGVVRRGVGALLRADDDRGRVRQAGSDGEPRPAGRGARPARPIHRRHPAARRGHVGRAGRCGSSATRRFWKRASARREAERGTFDPTYLVYSVGKLMLLKLRSDYKEQQGRQFSLRTFHDALLGNGTRRSGRDAPAHARATARRRKRWSKMPMPLYEYQCEACGRRFEVIQKFSDPPVDTVQTCGGPVRNCCRRPRSSSRERAGTSPTTRRRGSRPVSDSSAAARPTERRSRKPTAAAEVRQRRRASTTTPRDDTATARRDLRRR